MEHRDKRSQQRDRNRLALIEATLDCVAEKGIARTSVSAIIERASLSRGMIHLHFESKDKLLEAAVAHANVQYYDRLDRAVQAAGPRAQDTIDAIIRSDLSAEAMNPRLVSIWHAFRGEAHERKAFAAHSTTRDQRLRSMIFQAFLTLARDAEHSDPSELARDATHGTLAMMEGMWADYLLHPQSFNRDEAARIVFRFLTALLPGYFTLTGARP